MAGRNPAGDPGTVTEVRELGGTISGEHGIGVVQQPYMDIMFPPVTLDLMRSIKGVFDPRGILNPGKIFDDMKTEQGS